VARRPMSTTDARFGHMEGGKHNARKDLFMPAKGRMEDDETLENPIVAGVSGYVGEGAAALR